MRSFTLMFLPACLFFTTGTMFGQPKDAPPPTDPSLQDVVVPEIGTVPIGKRILRIWASTRNKQNEPETWQFRYDPLLLPEVGPDRKVSVSGPIQVNEWWEIAFRLNLQLPEVDRIVLQRVKELFPKEANKIKDGNVVARPVLWLTASLPESVRQTFPTARLARGQWAFGTPPPDVRITVRTATRDEAGKIMANLDQFELEMAFSVSAASTMKTQASVKAQHVKNSDLWVQLDGMSGQEVYIRRHDARRLLEDVRTLIAGDAIVEAPGKFDEQLLKGLFEKALLQKDELKEADAEKWKQTFHQDDLRPDHLTKTLNTIFVHDQGKWHFKRSAATEGAAKASVLKIFGGEGSFKASYSDDELKEFLKQYNITAQVEGPAILKAKGLDVYRVNKAALKAEFSVQLNWTEVRPPQVVSVPQSVNMGSLGRDAAGALLQVRADVARKEMEPRKAQADTARAEYKKEQWISEKGKAIAMEAEKAFDSGTSALRSASDELGRRDFALAAIRYNEARIQFERAGEDFIKATKEIEPERFVSLYAYVKTADDNKECGGWRIRVLQGGKQIFQDDWGWGENWDNGSESPPPAQRTKSMNVPVDGGKLEVFSSIEEKEGETNKDKPGGHQVRIDWDIDTMSITLKTNRGREITFQRKAFTHKSRGNGGALQTLDVPKVN